MDEEKAAYRFGGAFLAPDETLYRDVGKKRACIPAGELILLKKRFGISMQALIYRLHDLGIISDSHYRQWFKDISQLKWKKQEPSELEPEQPQWLRKSVLRSFAEDLISQEEAMKLLGEAAGQKKAPLSLVERRAFMNLPLEERRKILAKQAKEISDTIKPGETEDLETGEFLDD